MSFKDELARRARAYTQRRGLLLGEELGFGVDGIVFVVESQPETGAAPVRAAIKVHQSFARSLNACVTRIYLNWWEHLCYRTNRPYAGEVRTTFQSVTWLLGQYRHL